VAATRAGRTLYVEAKGRTSDPGMDADRMYGQLLRRVGAENDPQMLEPSGGTPSGACGAPPLWLICPQSRPSVYAVIDNEP
jgi:hypothetical protein